MKQNKVCTNLAQDFTDAEKAQGRSNIGAVSAPEVSTAISNAIGQLDVSDNVTANQFVTSVSESDGRVSVTRRQPVIADVDGLQDALGRITPQVQSDWTQADENLPSFIRNKPAIPAAQVNSDWNASTGVAEILNKPTLGTLASKNSVTDSDLSGTISDAHIASASTWNSKQDALPKTGTAYDIDVSGYASRAGVAAEVPWSGITSKPATSLTISSLDAVNLYTTLSTALNSMQAGTANYAWLNIRDSDISYARIAEFHSGSVSGIYYIVLSFYTMDSFWINDATKPWTLIVLSEKFQNCDRLFIPPHDTSFGGKHTVTGDFATSAAIGSLGYSGFSNYGYPGKLLWKFEPSLKLGWENTAYSGTIRPELYISKNADLNEWLKETNAKTYATMNILGRFNGTERSKYLSSYHYYPDSQGAHEVLSLADSYGLVSPGDFYKIEVEVWAQTASRQAAFHYTLSGMLHEEDGVTYGDYWWTGYYGGSSASGESTYWPGQW